MGFSVLGGGAGSRSVALTINGSTNNYDVAAAVAATGRSVAQGGLNVLVTLANGVIVGSTSTGVAALVTGAGWGAGCQVRVTVPSGSARIQGRGGNGGQGGDDGGARFGGGGGGAGTQAGFGNSNGGSSGTATTGGTGGISTSSFGARSATAGGDGGHAIEATSGGPNVFVEAFSGATFEIWGGGGGGGGKTSTGPAGDGGGPGLDGATPASGTAGGTHGKAYSTPGAATITETGTGTIDDRGA